MKTGLLIATTLALLLDGAPARCESATLPDGDGRDAVHAHCVGCHDLDEVTRSGYGEQAWRDNVRRMIFVGSTLPEEQVETVVRYLAAHFPEKPRQPATAVAGNVEVVITEWAVPTPGSRPHDPLAATDGSIWYTGQHANVMGRLDPRTGVIREYPLQTPESGPHGLAEDADGNIWFTANAKGYIGRLDPTTGGVTEYPMPDPAARDPHTPIFDSRGTLWFTVQGANMVGRLVPATGAVTLKAVPTPRSRPYGIVVDRAGVPWFVEFGANRIASINPATLEIREHALPHPETRPRRLSVTSDGALWYTDHARGFLGRFDPATGTAKEWPSPGGPDSRPYGIRAVGDIVWYSESGVSPNTLVRFDPGAGRFQTWAIPSGGGVVRHMDATAGGDLVLACSGVDRIALVTVKK